MKRKLTSSVSPEVGIKLENFLNDMDEFILNPWRFYPRSVSRLNPATIQTEADFWDERGGTDAMEKSAYAIVEKLKKAGYVAEFNPKGIYKNITFYDESISSNMKKLKASSMKVIEAPDGSFFVADKEIVPVEEAGVFDTREEAEDFITEKIVEEATEIVESVDTPYEADTYEEDTYEEDTYEEDTSEEDTYEEDTYEEDTSEEDTYEEDISEESFLELPEEEVVSAVRLIKSSSLSDKASLLRGWFNSWKEGIMSLMAFSQNVMLFLKGIGIRGPQANKAWEQIKNGVDPEDVLSSLPVAASVKFPSKRRTKIASETVSAREMADAMAEEVFLPEASGLLNAIEGDVIVSTPPVSEEDVYDPETDISRTEVGGESGVTSAPPTGDQGAAVIEAVEPGEPFNELYDFDTLEIAALEAPIEDSNNVQVIEFADIGSGVYVAKRFYERKANTRASSFRTGASAKEFLYSGRKPNFTKSSLKVNLDGRTVLLSATKQAILLKSSSIFGLVGIKGDFVKGLQNAEYSIFSMVRGRLVNPEGYEIQSSANRVIASVASNRAVVKSRYKRDLFTEVDKAYIQYLVSKLNKVVQEKKQIESSYKRQLDKVASTLGSQIRSAKSETSRYKAELQAQMQSLSSLRSSVKNQIAEDAIKTKNLLTSEAKLQAEQTRKNTERLARMMGAF